MSNDKRDKLKLNNDKIDSQKAQEKEKDSYSKEEFDWYTICKICLIRKCIIFDIMLSMIKYHQLLQIVEQIEDIHVAVLSGISKLNDSTSDKKRGDETQFSPKKSLE